MKTMMKEAPKHTPELTIGGNKAAEMATPIKAEIVYEDTPNATPNPEGMAMAAPHANPLKLPRDDISVLWPMGPSIDSLSKKVPTRNPIKTPHSQHTPNPKHSFRSEVINILLSRTIVPNVIPTIGPIKGLTSMEATTFTAELVNKPPAQIMAPTAIKAR
mmetsp:Transcript_16884/g.26875  ORF Transcript_16884/g.26875 Transcript_16884/m.26875 type:complete len:160 (+) Transcript_16884:154-633(+)